ncbi:MAG: DUF2961 domain-containing protein [Phycisphaerales bacterium]|nr:MAG: DUF2961 domain-containing protein [Phycisphaerales bacterium]
MITALRAFPFLITVCALAGTAGAETVTTGSLAREMVDLHRLAQFPSPAFETVQFSSYDHRATVPGGPDWFANSDGFGGEPTPNFQAVVREPDASGVGEYLICDVEGPGAIVRCWTAAIAGSIRMYLDGADEPVFEGTADDFLRRPFNTYAPNVGVDPVIFDNTFNQRNATYCPMPFAKRCRIVWIGRIPDIHFYEVQVRLYESDAKVVTFQPEDLREYEPELRQVARILDRPSRYWDYHGEEEDAEPITATIPAGESHEVLALENGPAAIERLMLKVDAKNLDLALRQTIMHITCDDFPHGQVQSPIGDFFGAAPGINPFDSVPFTVETDGTMTCRFVMPYKKNLRIRLENKGDQPVAVIGSALLIPYEWNDDDSMYFRALWRVDHDLVADPRAVQDLPFLIANGKGRYVGTTSLMLNPTDVPTPAGGWWGEGDEKIFVDDDTFPGTFGTGSEDYYNYAWSAPDIWGYAYCGQPRNDGPGNRGFVTNMRWHIVDSLPFKQRIAFYMELYSHKQTPGFSYARLAYHYVMPGVYDDHIPITGEDVRPLELAPNWQPLAWWGAANSVFIEPEAALMEGAARTEYEYVEGNLYSSGRLFVWKPAMTGETLSFLVTIEEAGKYSADLCMAKTPDSGRFRAEFALDAVPREGRAPDPIDLFADGRTVLRRIQGRQVELEPGKYVLTLTAVGEPGKEIGIDFIWLKKH